MGLLSWIRGQNSRTPKPPWVRPEFLSMFALALTAVVGIGYWATLESRSDGPNTVAAQEHREYVGIQPAELATELPCEVDCYVAWLWDSWVQDHPDAVVVSKTPVEFQGVVIGYDVVWRAS